ncbi:hypothetical protein D0869_11924 [Hortaea werneckii]|uniref:Uncharacterized protein n=1 Tax=Hortaea werneckii TaxID=91943 RepID=A0A3M7DHL4_HORWE|nr:hypothetical protein KC334_g15018 [Hortaea werneckii]KAI6936939.1 hypothetical protein KC355_g15861 [Hortaea werneckii]KAI7187250.1 hypothetical protein KC324_g6957 [Hortaea werneckii]KAI7307887.1 hypothetical protein KC315_g13610 [Hortaea werneckii]KAI7585004.1 hypothetical protein KC316_g6388 [Hortaea werneckii]
MSDHSASSNHVSFELSGSGSAAVSQNPSSFQAVGSREHSGVGGQATFDGDTEMTDQESGNDESSVDDEEDDDLFMIDTDKPKSQQLQDLPAQTFLNLATKHNSRALASMFEVTSSIIEGKTEQSIDEAAQPLGMSSRQVRAFFEAARAENDISEFGTIRPAITDGGGLIVRLPIDTDKVQAIVAVTKTLQPRAAKLRGQVATASQAEYLANMQKLAKSEQARNRRVEKIKAEQDRAAKALLDTIDDVE